MEIVRFRIADIAREAGVSVATVDRVLNNRDGVRRQTRERVLGVAGRLGYVVASTRSRSARTVRLDFILPGGTNSYINMLADDLAAEATLRGDELAATIHRIEGFNPDALARKLAEIGADSDGIGLIALDHPTVREAIRATISRGVPVATLVSDISNVAHIGYIGIDNRAAGRLAGHLLGRFMGPEPGKVALFAGSLSYRGHEEREMGFRHILREEFPNLAIVGFHEVQDDRPLAYEGTRHVLAAHADLGGIYNAGGGNRGIVRALTETGQMRAVVYVCHELTEQTRHFLLSGVVDAVIDQSARLEATESIELLRAKARGEDHAPTPIPLRAIFKENIP